MYGLAHATGVHERNTVPMHETQFRGKARIVCQTQGKARFRHVSGTGLTHCMHILRTARHVFGKLQKITSFRGKSWGLPVGKKQTNGFRILFSS